MKTREYIDKIQANRWVRTIALGFAAFIVFSYMYTRAYPRVGCGSHRVFQGILQVPLPDSLPSGGCGHTFLHTQFSGILTIFDHET